MYKTKKGNAQLVDIYADDLSVYLEYNFSNQLANESNVLETLATIELFYKWSGLKVNREKTQLTILAKNFQNLVLL